MKSENEKIVPGQSKSARKKPYDSPKLSKFGTVAQLTLQHGVGPINDSGMNMMAAS